MSSVLKYARNKDIAFYLTGLTYQTALNVLIWAQALTETEISDIISTGIFNSQQIFIEQASAISQYVKPFSQYTRAKNLLGELHVLEGYRHIDKNWNLQQEMQKLAQCNPQRPTDWAHVWDKAATQVIPNLVNLPKWESFEDYTKSLKWTTTGSSSVGKVYYNDGGKIKHFKPRKNMVTALFTPDQIWQIVQKWDGTIKNLPVVKNELGKIRLAIASNFESYIYEAYCLDMLGHCFKNWGGITLDESVEQEYKRISRDMKLLKDQAIALPWDFAGFDHQVRTDEIQDILNRLKLLSDSRTYDVWDKVIGSYSHATLSDPVSGITFTVNNGLQSGQRTTSLIGNIWNAIVSRAAIDKVTGFLGYNPQFTIGIRGDDTYILGHSIFDLYMLRLSYASFGIIGHDKKFSIREGSYEFLRNTVTETGVFGWPARAVPAITERKPWSDDMLAPANEVITIADNIRNFERRVGEAIPELHMANKFQWSKFTKQSYNWLHLPKRLGGLGIYPFKGFIPDGKLSLTPELTVNMDTEFSSFSPSYLGLSSSQSRVYNKTRFLSMVRPSDMRNLLSDIMSKFSELKEAMVRKRLKWTKTKVDYLTSCPTQPEIIKLDVPIKISLKSVDQAWPEYTQFLSDYPGLRVATKGECGSLASITKIKYPQVAGWIKRIERYGYHRADAIDMVLGKYPSELIWPLNTKVTQQVVSHLQPGWVKPPFLYARRDRIGYYLYMTTRSAVRAFASSTRANLYRY